MNKEKSLEIGFFQKYLTIWVALCMITGILIGKFILRPDLSKLTGLDIKNLITEDEMKKLQTIISLEEKKKRKSTREKNSRRNEIDIRNLMILSFGRVS